MYAIISERDDINNINHDPRAMKFHAAVGSTATMVRGRCTLILEKLKVREDTGELEAGITLCVDDVCKRAKPTVLKDRSGPFAKAVKDDGFACVGAVYLTPSTFPLAEP